jgi:hypothetical protein
MGLGASFAARRGLQLFPHGSYNLFAGSHRHCLYQSSAGASPSPGHFFSFTEKGTTQFGSGEGLVNKRQCRLLQLTCTGLAYYGHAFPLALITFAFPKSGTLGRRNICPGFPPRNTPNRIPLVRCTLPTP